VEREDENQTFASVKPKCEANHFHESTDTTYVFQDYANLLKFCVALAHLASLCEHCWMGSSQQLRVSNRHIKIIHISYFLF